MFTIPAPPFTASIPPRQTIPLPGSFTSQCLSTTPIPGTWAALIPGHIVNSRLIFLNTSGWDARQGQKLKGNAVKVTDKKKL